MREMLINIIVVFILILVLLIVLITIKNKVQEIDASFAQIAAIVNEEEPIDIVIEEEKKPEIEVAETVEPVMEETEQAAVLSDAERDLIERVVAAESRGEPYEGMMAVAQCIKDRGDDWNMTYTEVVTKKGQFASPYKGIVSENVKQAVYEVFDLNRRVTEEPIYHFFNPAKCNPDWAKNKTKIATIGNHEFYF